MKRVLLLGATGMLGNAIYKALSDKHLLILGIRNQEKLKLLENTHGNTAKHTVIEFDALEIFSDFKNKKGNSREDFLTKFIQKVGDIDYVINAIGVTVPGSIANPELALFLNGALPHLLAQNYGPKLINITTDCAYNGLSGYPYDENSPKSPVDIYGLSKIIGEPIGCLNIRTSLIGRELEGKTGLLEWFLSQKGGEINGYANQIWSGITTIQYGHICDQIISNPDQFPRIGTFHIFGEAISKYEMLLRFQKKYNIDCKIIPVAEPRVNRSLATIYDFNAKFKIPSFDKMLEEL